MANKTVVLGRKIVEDVNALLQKYAEENNLKVEMKQNFSYTADSVYLKGVIFHIPQAGKSPDTVLTEEEKLYDLYAPSEGLPVRGTPFVKSGVQYRIYGWKPRARKNQVLVVASDTNQRFSCPVSTVLHYLK